MPHFQHILKGVLSQSNGVIPTTPLLDLFPNAVTAYSLRLLRTAYSGNCLRVIRSSDSTAKDIGFLNGHIDIADLLAFVGAGDGIVDRWYDQAANNNAYSDNSGERPYIAIGGAYLGEILCNQDNNAGRHLKYTTPYVAGQAEVSVYVVGRLINNLPDLVANATNALRNIQIFYNAPTSLSVNVFRGVGGNGFTNTIAAADAGVLYSEHQVHGVGANRSLGYQGVNFYTETGADSNNNFTIATESRIGSNGTNRVGGSGIRELVHWNSYQYTNNLGIATNMGVMR
jgi:hypothetical protein